MRYLCLICTDENAIGALSPKEAEAMTARYMKFQEEAGARLEGGARLRPTSDSTTVQVRDGETLTLDGPFAETKEQVGGYYILDCKDLDEAIAWAARIPASCKGGVGCVEIRPIAGLPPR
jgi:hypothetical protein